MDKLDQFIKQQSAAFDEVETPENELIWMGIQSKLQESELDTTAGSTPRVVVLPRSWALGMVATIVLLLAFSIWLITSPQQKETTIAIEEYLPEIAAQEANFQQRIAEKKAEIDFENIKPEEFNEIFLELKLLDEIRSEYLRDVPAYNQEDQLVEVLIKYYERKIQILERLSNEIEKKKNYEKYHREKRI